jgi:16S rRNA (uracil1498-N3)-methyltransferase
VAATPLTARAHVFVADLASPMLDAADHHHLARVLRLPVGTDLTMSDGHGRWRPGRLTAEPPLAIAGEVRTDPRPDPAITVAFALVKGERPELVVQKLTELGVDRIVPFVADRSVARWQGERAVRHVARLRRVAREAAVQARLVFLPVVTELTDFGSVAAVPGAARCDRGGAPPRLDHPVLLVGPEGGWSDAERDHRLPVVGLGPTILRAETAAIAAGALLTALRAGVVVARGGSDA